MQQTNGTYIGKTMVIRGEVSGTEDLHLEGVIDGTITLHDGRLTVGPEGHAKAKIAARELVASGRVEGNVVAKDRAELRGNATFTGDLVAARLSVQGEATLKASVDLTEGRIHKTQKNAPKPAAEEQGQNQQETSTTQETVGV